MFDNPEPLVSQGMNSYGTLDDDLPEELIKYCEECHDKLTVDQLRNVADFFNSKADKLSSAEREKITMDDFEKLKKEDVDDDQEEKE